MKECAEIFAGQEKIYLYFVSNTDLCVPYCERVWGVKEARRQDKKIMSNEGGSQWIKDHELDFEKWLTFPPEDTECEFIWIFSFHSEWNC